MIGLTKYVCFVVFGSSYVYILKLKMGNETTINMFSIPLGLKVFAQNVLNKYIDYNYVDYHFEEGVCL